MRVAQTSLGNFIIVRRESGMYEQGFTMFVDDNKVSWTSKLYFAQKFQTKERAEETIKEIRRRNKERRPETDGA